MPTSKDNQLTNVATFVAAGLGSGYSPVASGTAGSIAALATYALLHSFGILTSSLHDAVFAAIVVILGFLATYISISALSSEQKNSEMSKNGKLHLDPKYVVADEWAGMLISVLGVGLQPMLLFTAFILFRLFDVLKPWPISAAEKLGGATGIMLDDLIAGIFTLILIYWVIAPILGYS